MEKVLAKSSIYFTGEKNTSHDEKFAKTNTSKD